MSDEKRAYDHRAELPGTADETDPPPALEHRDTASGNARARNELSPEERGDPEHAARRTHQDTRIDRQGLANED